MFIRDLIKPDFSFKKHEFVNRRITIYFKVHILQLINYKCLNGSKSINPYMGVWCHSCPNCYLTKLFRARLLKS